MQRLFPCRLPWQMEANPSCETWYATPATNLGAGDIKTSNDFFNPLSHPLCMRCRRSSDMRGAESDDNSGRPR